MANRPELTMPPLAGRYLLLVALALVLAPHLLRLPPWLALAVALVLGWRLLRDHRGWLLPPTLVRVALTALGIGAVLLVFHTIIGREPGTALLSVLLSLKLLELRTLRDAMIAVFLGYFLVVVGFFFDESIFAGFYMFVVVLTLTTALIALNHPSSQLSLTRSYLKSSLLLLLQAVPLMVLLFVLFPRISSPLWHMPESESRGLTGLSDEMNMGTVTDLAESDELAFRVEFNGPIPPANRLYWRGPVLWTTDGRRWLRLTKPELAELNHAPLSYPPGSSVVDYTITLEPEKGKWLFALDLPLSQPKLDGGAVLLPDYQLLSLGKIDERVRYQLRSALVYRTPPLSQPERSYALQLPEYANPRSRALAEGWRKESHDDAALVARALAYFREQPFYYTRQPPALGSDPVDEFLFETRRGFCEHYASAFVTLMRAAGIPARVVTGYQGGEFNPVGNFLEVRQNRAHAWAEVWLNNQGWTRVDPTSVIPPQRVLLPEDSSRFASTTPANVTIDLPFVGKGLFKLQQMWGAVNYAWNIWVLGFDEQRQRDLLRRLGLDRIDWRDLVVLLFGSLAFTLLLITALLLWRRPPARDPEVILYQRFCRKLAKAGLEHQASEGPRQLASRACSRFPDQARQIAAIIDCYIELRYSKAQPGARRQLRRLIRRFHPR